MQKYAFKFFVFNLVIVHNIDDVLVWFAINREHVEKYATSTISEPAIVIISLLPTYKICVRV